LQAGQLIYGLARAILQQPLAFSDLNHSLHVI